MSSRAKVIVLAAVVLAFVSGYMVSNLVSAPAVALILKNDWRTAVQNGVITPVTAWDNGLESFYPGQTGQLRLTTFESRDDVNPIAPGLQQGMFMDWGSAADQGGPEIIGGWKYDFGVAQDLNATIIDLVDFSPCPFISSFAVGLRDATGNVMSWMWAIPANQGCDVDISLSVNPVAGPNLAPTATYTDVGFDLTQVTHMMFYERGLYDAANPPNPRSGELVWNSWGHLVLSATVPVEETTWGSVKDLYKE